LGQKDDAMQAVTIAELKVQFAPLFAVARRDTELLERFAQGRLKRSFVRIDLAAGSVNLACAETALLPDEENFSFSHNEEEGGTDAGLPDCPIGHVAQTLISCPQRGART